jgi:hypothetical protein
MPNPAKFNRARVEAYRLYARIRSEVESLDLDERQDVLEELSTVCTLHARDIENAIIDAESDRLRVVARIMHPSLDARERNPSLR